MLENCTKIKVLIFLYFLTVLSYRWHRSFRSVRTGKIANFRYSLSGRNVAGTFLIWWYFRQTFLKEPVVRKPIFYRPNNQNSFIFPHTFCAFSFVSSVQFCTLKIQDFVGQLYWFWKFWKFVLSVVTSLLLINFQQT